MAFQPERWVVSCESSGIVREQIRALGHYAISCDLQPADDGSEFHYQGDIRDILNDGWDGMIAHPPCTFLSSSGLHWNVRVDENGALLKPGRAALTEEALEFVRLHLEARIPKIALENPIGCISSRIRKPDQIVQPWQFGDDASKATCLWLKGLPKLIHTNVLPGGRAERRANQTASGQNRLPPSKDRWKLRSMTYPGIARAMATQWCGTVHPDSLFDSIPGGSDR